LEWFLGSSYIQECKGWPGTFLDKSRFATITNIKYWRLALASTVEKSVSLASNDSNRK